MLKSLVTRSEHDPFAHSMHDLAENVECFHIQCYLDGDSRGLSIVHSLHYDATNYYY